MNKLKNEKLHSYYLLDLFEKVVRAFIAKNDKETFSAANLEARYYNITIMGKTKKDINQSVKSNKDTSYRW